MFKKLSLFVLILTLTIMGLPGVQASEVTTINYWHYLSGENADIHEELVHRFNEEHPHIHVDVLFTGNQFVTRDKLLASVAGGLPPEVSLVDQFWPPLMVSTGALVPINTFVDPDAYLTDFSQISKDTVTVNGQVWTIPFSLSNQVLLYNKDMFSAVGLDPDKPPTTWEELVDYAKVLTRDVDGDGRIDEWGINFTTRANVGAVYTFITFLWQAGGQIYSDDFTQAAFNDPLAKEAVQFWIDLVHKHQVLTLSPPQEGFEIGRIAMQYSSTSSIEATKQKVNFDLGAVPLPGYRNTVTGVGGSSLAIFKTTPKKAAAWEFVEWMSSAENNLEWSMSTGYIPLRLSVRNSTAYREYLEDEPHMKVVLAQSDYAKARPNTASYADVSRLLAVAVEEALYGNIDPEQILNNAVIEANTFIQELDLTAR